ncbi:MAG: cyclic nucleotide-binding domain-containing protein [Nitrospirae bacterium]|nr:MAG: cyclic nucleotide-binding domain-containing protein [Nitrospirota bacterium]
MSEAEDLCLRMKRELGFFHYLREEEVEQIGCYFQRREAEAGEVLWREGERCDYLCVIVAGHIEVKKETEFGRQVIVGLYGPGSIAGELCLFDGSPRAVTAVAVEPTTLVVLSREGLERLLEEHPRIGGRFLQGILVRVARRLRRSFDRLAEVF